MEYGININYFTRVLTLEKAAELIAKSGFTKLDYTPPLMRESWAQDMKAALGVFKDYGLKVHQTHAPFNRYGTYKESHSLCLDRCAEATAVMGAEFMVAHGDEFDFDAFEFSPEAALDHNHRLFLPYVELGEKCGYKIAFETVFEDARKVRRYTSDADELMDLISSFKKDNVVCCWDSGHAHVSFKNKAPDIIRRFGSLIKCTHIHDNTGSDSHQMPMSGDIDWKKVMDAFRDIGYQGVTSVEYAHGKLPQDLMEDFITLTYRSAESLWRL